MENGTADLPCQVKIHCQVCYSTRDNAALSLVEHDEGRVITNFQVSSQSFAKRGGLVGCLVSPTVSGCMPGMAELLDGVARGVPLFFLEADRNHNFQTT